MIRQFCNNICKVLEVPVVNPTNLDMSSQSISDQTKNQEAAFQDYLTRVFKQAQKGADCLKKSAHSMSFTNVLNQSTDAISNRAGLHKVADISSSFIKDNNDAEDDVISFESQSNASSNLPSFDGSKMFAKK